MKTHIALLRGINVGGHNKLPMRELVQDLEALGLRRVKTYIQSGNVVFQSDEGDLTTLSEMIRDAIDRGHGFSPDVIVLDVEGLRQAIAANPFPEGAAEPKSLHFYFLGAGPKNPDLEGLAASRTANERFALIDSVFYLHAPDGIGRSKLAERVGRGWGVTVTARNQRTVSKLLEMAEEAMESET